MQGKQAWWVTAAIGGATAATLAISKYAQRSASPGVAEQAAPDPETDTGTGSPAEPASAPSAQPESAVTPSTRRRQLLLWAIPALIAGAEAGWVTIGRLIHTESVWFWWALVGFNIALGSVVLMAVLLGPAARHLATPHYLPDAERAQLTVKERVDAVSSARQTLIQSATGLVVIGGVLFTALGLWYTARTLDSTQQGQITDRYTKAVEQLGARDQEVRLGGIYALQRIGYDSPRDQPTVMQVLAAYIRVHAQNKPPPGSDPSRLAVDVQAAFNVIGDRDTNLDVAGGSHPGLRRIDLNHADLHGKNLTSVRLVNADLSGANLSKSNALGGIDMRGAELLGANLKNSRLLANLSGADLPGADLSGSYLEYSSFEDANLNDANLTGADLNHARIRGAQLTRTALRRAGLSDADMQGAVLISADLTSADLTRADLRGAAVINAVVGMTQAQIRAVAFTDRSTLFGI